MMTQNLERYEFADEMSEEAIRSRVRRRDAESRTEVERKGTHLSKSASSTYPLKIL